MSGFFKENPADTVVGSPDADETQISEDAAEVNDISSAFYKGSDNRTQVEAEEQSAREAREAAEAAQAAAEASQASAATSSTNAASSASSASSSEAAAAVSATNAANSATSASTSASNAATSASNSATNATSAANSATAASTSASSAATSETAASTSAINAASSASSAASAQAAAEAAYDDFDDRYLGAKTSDPSTDNDGNSLVTGALYFNTTDNIMKVYNGTAWLSVAASLSGALLASNNLSDVVSASAARTNLGLVDVASTGDYSDLFGTPTAVSAFTNDAGYLVSDSDGSDLQNVRAETVEVTLKNVSGASIAKGTPVHQTGTSGSSTFEVIPSLAGTASTMPAHFVAAEAIADQAEGRGILMGRITGVDTSSFAEGDTIYVGASGGYTNTAPTGEGNLVQNLGTVTRVDATHGGGEVFGAGRSNATPNLNNGNIFIGNASNQAATASLSSSVSGLLHYNNTNWDTAYGWGNHALAGYLTSYTETDPTVPAHVKSITTGNISNWNTAYGWGDHSAAGYLTSFTETDPTVPSHVKSITTTNISNWNTAYGWGDHSAAGYLTSFSETDPTVPSHVKSITTTNISNWNTAYGWGDHAAAGYQAAATALTTSTTFGGDVSGTYNAIVVADDSHNHIISNVDGLQSALDAKAPISAPDFTGEVYTSASQNAWAFRATTGASSNSSGLWFTGETARILLRDSSGTIKTQLSADGSTSTNQINGNPIFHDGYHPNADKWTTARTLSLTGDVTGSVSWDGSGNASLSATVVDDSHNHIISNVDGLQTALDGKVDLSGDTMSGDLIISKADARLKLYDSTGTSGNNPYVEWETTANQGIAMELNVYDGELPVSGYGLVVREGPSNGQFPTTGTLTFNVLGEIYAGATSLGSLNKVFHGGYAPFAGLTAKTSGTGTYQTNGDFRAPIFYDSDNTGFNLNANGSAWQLQTPTGYLRAGPMNTSFCHFNTDRPRYYFDKEVQFDNGINDYSGNWQLNDSLGQHNSSLRAPIFYDSNNTAYYLNPASTSVVNQINYAAGLYFSGNTNYGINGTNAYLDTVNSGAVGDPLELCYARGNEVRIGPSGGNLPIKAATYYDYADTSYYVDPNSTSVLNGADFDGIVRIVTGSVGPANTTDGLMFDGNYTNGQYRHRFRKRDDSGGIPLYLDYAAGTANSYTELMKFGPNTADGSYLTVYGQGYATGNFRAPLFYDSDDTAYYVNPSSTSVCSTVQAVNYQTGAGNGRGYRFWGSDSYKIYMSSTADGTWGGRVTGETTSDYNMYFRMTGGTNRGFVFRNNTTNVAGIDAGGIGRFTGSLRAPLFYDNNNTAYYADLGSTGSSIRTAGPVSVGTTSSAVQLTVAGAAGVDGIDLQVDTTSSVNSGRMFWTNGTAGQGVAIYNGSGNMYLTTGATPNSTSGGTRMAIYSGNYVTASGSFRAPVFYDNDNTGRYADLSSTGDSIRASGDIVAYYSDDRLKDRGDNIANALDKVQSLNGFHYTANETAQKFGYKANPQVGVSAQEVEAVLPEVVKEAAIGHGYKTVDYAKLVPLLIEAIKELKAEVETLKKG